MPSSVLLLLVVAGFGLLVVPALVLRHDFVADRNDSFGVRVLPRRPSADGMDEDDLDDVDEVIDAVEVAETTAEAVEPTGQPEYAEDAEPDEVPAAAPAAVSAAVRRRRVLAVLCALAFAVVFPAALVDARLWVAQAAVDALVVGYLLQARRAVVKARARRRAAERRRYAAEREAVPAEPVEAPEPAAPAGPRYQPLLPVPEHLTAMARQARYGSGVIEQAPAPEPEPEEAPRAVPLRRVANG
ncbi:MAG: hypothetical protein ACJ73S_19600 [Mycobacteriales bacterium]